VFCIGSSNLRRVSAIDPANGHVGWRSDARGWTWGTPLIVGDRIYAGAAGGTPYFVKHLASLSTLDLNTGRMLTRWPLPDTGGHQWGIAGSPVRDGDRVIVATIEGSLYAFPVQ
jgi:outer membrane protein assembly factor BamB